MRTTLFMACVALSVMVPATRVTAQSTQDKAIAQEIGNQLKASGQLRDYRIGVKYKEGVAALSGTVTDQQQLITAVRLTQGMSNVHHVVNNLTITGQSNSLAKPASQQTGRASYHGPGPQAALATRTSYQPNGAQQPMIRQPMNGQANQGQAMQRQPQYQGLLPMGQRPRGPMNAGRMPAQGRGNAPLPMGRPQVQQAMAQQQMAMQAGCSNCGPGGGGMGGGGYDGGMMGGPPAMGYVPGGQSGAVNYDNAQMPGYAWPSYAAYPNYAALSYPKQYSPSAWPYIGPFYPYPQVPLGWRKVSLEWDDGWWFLDFSDTGANH